MAQLQSIGKEIWLADGGNVDFYGFPYSVRMIIVRLPDGDLWVWSPIDLDDGLRAEVDALGPVAHLVSPNKIHHLSLGAWKADYPAAHLWGPASTIAKREDLSFEPALDQTVPASWGDVLEMIHFTGSVFMDELVFFHHPSSTAILADLSENFEEDFIATYWRGWQLPIARVWGIMSGKAPLEWRLSFFRKAAARAARDTLLGFDPRQVVMAHGKWQAENGREFLAKSLSWLGR